MIDALALVFYLIVNMVSALALVSTLELIVASALALGGGLASNLAGMITSALAMYCVIFI